MKINKLHEISFDTNDTIITSTLSKPNELVMLLSSGSVIKYDLESQKEEQLFSIKNDIVYPDGGFDTAAKSSIYTLDDIVVVVNDYKRHGFIHNPEKYYTLHLWREDYHADISCYPITLYKNKINIPHIIYGVAWNHVQIMNLDTRQILTASKSLIEENAEENYKYVIEKCGEHNKLPWPLPYDYFFGKLQISPNGEYFLSAGWGWGSCDLYKIYNIGYFLNSNRISDISIGGWGMKIEQFVG
ncbi:hypothetical protein GO730_03415 [Spirosoma sp. HMF3257]|uniref:Uncharacterized protein n=1 Tax=Spirosoma telluris TaxID=2183553 RepID=A0A327NEF4_9BACT|nr:hypothetical protein [Spirosoma telluris]RAI73690.1 hypothetical protein HMF3257_03345 [Spirosoma telluris]